MMSMATLLVVGLSPFFGDLASQSQHEAAVTAGRQSYAVSFSSPWKQEARAAGEVDQVSLVNEASSCRLNITATVLSATEKRELLENWQDRARRMPAQVKRLEHIDAFGDAYAILLAPRFRGRIEMIAVLHLTDSTTHISVTVVSENDLALGEFIAIEKLVRTFKRKPSAGGQVAGL